jgi:hypothetical protein
LDLKKCFFFLIGVLLFLQADESESSWNSFRRGTPEQPSQEIGAPGALSSFSSQWDLQARAGYFQFTSRSVRKIYGTGAPDIELEGSVKLHPYLALWSNLNYVWKGGHSTPLDNNTHLDLLTLSIGANAITSIKWSFTFIYLGLGLSGAYVHTKDESSYLPTNASRFGVGCVGKFGLLVFCTKHFFVNPFFDYYYQPISAKSSATYSSVNLGGFRTGLGLGYQF